MAIETKHVIVLVLEINEEHRVKIKNTYYSCIYFTRILYYFNKLKLKIVCFLLLKKCVAYSEAQGIQESIVFKVCIHSEHNILTHPMC
jgi:hypothetical protein